MRQKALLQADNSTESIYDFDPYTTRTSVVKLISNYMDATKNKKFQASQGYHGHDEACIAVATMIVHLCLMQLIDVEIGGCQHQLDCCTCWLCLPSVLFMHEPVHPSAVSMHDPAHQSAVSMHEPLDYNICDYPSRL